MKKRLQIFLSASLLLTALVVSTVNSPLVIAASTNKNTSITSNGNGYRISPVRTDLTINPGQSGTVTVYLTNISKTGENLQIQVDDFTAKNETGTPALLINGQTLPHHDLKQFVILPTKSISLDPGQQKSIKVTVSIPKIAVPGGYYGAIRFTPVGANGDKNVNLAASVGSLVLVKVPGDIKESLSIVGFGVGHGDSPSSFFTSHKGLHAIVRFQNNGDIQEEPFGKVELKQGSKVLGTYEINKSVDANQRGNVLPDSIRRFEVPLDKVGSFGKFTVEGNFGYGSNGQLLSATSTFYVIPLGFIIAAIIIILIIIAAIILIPRAIKSHDRRLLRRLRRQRRS